MKHLFITLKVQDGENVHTHRVLTTCDDHDNILQAADEYAKDYYGEAEDDNDGWWYFHSGSIAVKVENVELLSEYEYKLMQNIFSGNSRPGYFQIVQTGYETNLNREEVEINCGQNGKIMIHQDEDKLGFIIDVYGQNNEAGTMTIWEEDLIDDEPTAAEVKAYIKEWGQKQGEITSNLGYPKSHSESDDLLMEDYFFLEGKKQWYPKISRMYSEREQLTADYVRNNRDNY